MFLTSRDACVTNNVHPAPTLASPTSAYNPIEVWWGLGQTRSPIGSCLDSGQISARINWNFARQRRGQRLANEILTKIQAGSDRIWPGSYQNPGEIRSNSESDPTLVGFRSNYG